MLLVARRGEAIAKQIIFAEVWSDVVVSDGALSQAVRTLRRTLGDDSREPRFIRTVSRHGYQFVCDGVEETSDDDPLAVAAETGGAEPIRPATRSTGSIDRLATAVQPGGSWRRGGRPRRAPASARHRGGAGARAARPDHARLVAVLREARWNVPRPGPSRSSVIPRRGRHRRADSPAHRGRPARAGQALALGRAVHTRRRRGRGSRGRRCPRDGSGRRRIRSRRLRSPRSARWPAASAPRGSPPASWWLEPSRGRARPGACVVGAVAAVARGGTARRGVAAGTLSGLFGLRLPGSAGAIEGSWLGAAAAAAMRSARRRHRRRAGCSGRAASARGGRRPDGRRLCAGGDGWRCPAGCSSADSCIEIAGVLPGLRPGARPLGGRSASRISGPCRGCWSVRSREGFGGSLALGLTARPPHIDMSALKISRRSANAQRSLKTFEPPETASILRPTKSSGGVQRRPRYRGGSVTV